MTAIHPGAGANRAFMRSPARERYGFSRQRRLRTMHKVIRALQVMLLCGGFASMSGIQGAYAAEGSASPGDSAGANAAASSNDSAQREWRERLRRPPAPAQGTELFETKNWLPEAPPPKRPVARAPEPPRPPPFPYQFLGRLETDGKPRTVYLTKNSEVYSAVPGEVIEGTYRVIDVSAESMEVLYLPLNMKQQIAFASIVPTPSRQASRVSDTPAIVAPTSVSIPPPMNLSPPRGDGRAAAPAPQPQASPADAPRGAPRGVPGRGSSAPQEAAAAAGTQDGGAPPANPQTSQVAPSLSPSPVVVSPPTLSFGGKPPAAAPAAGAPTAGAAPSAPTPGAPPSAPGATGAPPQGAAPSGRM
jgi:hypothetical protein